MTTSNSTTIVTGYSYGQDKDGCLDRFVLGRRYDYIRVHSQYGWEDGCQAKDSKVLRNVICTKVGRGCAHSVDTSSFEQVENVYVEFCADCGAEVGWWSQTYINENPAKHKVDLKNAYLHQRSGDCTKSPEYSHIEVCPDCDTEVGRWTIEFATKHPEALATAIAAAHDGHKGYCPMGWKDWRESNKALEDETPYEFISRLRDMNSWEELYNVTCPPDRLDNYYNWPDEIEEMVTSLQRG